MLINFKDFDLETPIYRVFSLDKILDLLINSKLTLVKPKLWDDPFENFLFKQTVKDSYNENIPLGELEKSVFGNCWTLNSDTDFGWKVYAPNKDGIQVQTTIAKLHNHLNEMLPDNHTKLIKVGKVQYWDWRRIKDHYEKEGGFNWLDLMSSMNLFFKRTEFVAENEIRVLAVNKSKVSDDIWQLDIDPNILIDKMLVDPRVSDSKFNVIKKVIQKLGYEGQIEKSELYSIPKLEITLGRKNI